MIKLLRDFRLLPVVLMATVCLLLLKTLGLVLDGSSFLDGANDSDVATMPMAIDPGQPGDIVGSIGKVASAGTPSKTPVVAAPLVPAKAPMAETRQSWAQAMFNFPDVTGSIGADKKPAAAPPPTPPAAAAAEKTKPGPKGKLASRVPPTAPADMVDRRKVSPAERAILERLQSRREELDSRARQLDMRETLIKAAEKRLEAKLAELKQVESSINVAKTKEGQAEAARFKGLISMYENMKPKDAARIFDRLDMKILANVAGRINPRQMADIMAQMSPEIAERLTVEFASRDAPKNPDVSRLPKIEGEPTPAH